MQTQEDIKALTYGISPTISEKDEEEKEAGFYEQEDETTLDVWDVREDDRAMKDMDID